MSPLGPLRIWRQLRRKVQLALVGSDAPARLRICMDCGMDCGPRPTSVLIVDGLRGAGPQPPENPAVLCDRCFLEFAGHVERAAAAIRAGTQKALADQVGREVEPTGGTH
jgi:hypothetical protein